jgi:hypothetical protein
MEQVEEHKQCQTGGIRTEPSRGPSRPKIRYRPRGHQHVDVELFDTELLRSWDGAQPRDKPGRTSNATLQSNTPKPTNKRLFGGGIALLVLASTGAGFASWDTNVLDVVPSVQTAALQIASIANTRPEPMAISTSIQSSVQSSPPTQVMSTSTDTSPQVVANLNTKIEPLDRPVLVTPVIDSDLLTVLDPPPASVLPVLRVQLNTPIIDASLQVAPITPTRSVRHKRPVLPALVAAPVSFKCSDCQSVNPHMLNVLLKIYTTPNATAQSLVAVAERGFAAGVTTIIPTASEITVNYNQVRVFHAADDGAAQILARSYAATVVDLTWFTPLPPLGTIELHLAGLDPT